MSCPIRPYVCRRLAITNAWAADSPRSTRHPRTALQLISRSALSTAKSVDISRCLAHLACPRSRSTLFSLTALRSVMSVNTLRPAKERTRNQLGRSRRSNEPAAVTQRAARRPGLESRRWSAVISLLCISYGTVQPGLDVGEPLDAGSPLSLSYDIGLESWFCVRSTRSAAVSTRTTVTVTWRHCQISYLVDTSELPL
jgi:hypothetical protein